MKFWFAVASAFVLFGCISPLAPRAFAEDIYSLIPITELLLIDKMDILATHKNLFTQRCKIADREKGFETFQKIKEDLTHVNAYGDRSKTIGTTVTDSILSRLYKIAEKINIEFKGYERSLTAGGLAGFALTHHEDSSGPTPVITAYDIDPVNREQVARAGDLVEIWPPQQPFPHFVKIESIKETLDGEPIPSELKSAKERYKESLQSGYAYMSFSILAHPSYNPTLKLVDRSKTEHFYDHSSTIEWATTYDLAKGELTVSASSYNVHCNLNENEVQTYPYIFGTETKLGRAVLNLIVCELQWKQNMQDMMWKPYTESFLKDANQDYYPGLSADTCHLEVEKWVDNQLAE